MLTEITLAEYGTLSPKTVSKLISVWINFATEESLRLKIDSKNAVDMICDASVAPHLDDLEALIFEIVRRGGRLTSENAPGVDFEAVEIYGEALRSIQQLASATTALSSASMEQTVSPKPS
jgi:hypothetical protein